MTDFTQPTNTTLVATVLQILKERDVSIAQMDYSDDTNISTGFVRYNRTNRVFEEWTGSAWYERRVEAPGVIKAFAGNSAPRGHVLCDGTSYSKTDPAYAPLYAVIGGTYGESGSEFNVPDLRGRFPLGVAASGTGSTLGVTGGSLDHTHTVPAHHHALGAGADLNITSSGTHTTTIDIQHNHTASSSSNFTGVSVSNGGYTSQHTVSLTDNGHAHTVYGHGTTTAGDGKNTGNSSNKFAKGRETAVSGTGDTNGTSSSNTTGITLNNGAHSHSVGLSDPKHNHTITVDSLASNTARTDTSGLHTHTSSTFAGKIGLVTGGVDGNTEMVTGSGNPPFMAVNYIISL